MMADMDLTNLGLGDWGMAVAVMFVALILALVLWRILKRAIGGCISMGLGCPLLLVTLAAVVLYLLSGAGLVSLDAILP
jgi:hypothetical protein